jgi:hypothetical protein
MEQKNYKRQTREMPQEVKDKISASLRGRAKSYSHRLAISDGMKAETGGYWSHIPPKSHN